jgi:hypothetical protein
MAIDTPPARSRRAVLAGALGAGLASLAAALGRPRAAAAADDQPMLVGGEYTSSSVTQITNSTTGHTVLAGVSSSGTGVYGQSTTYYGVHGSSTSFPGVFGASTSNPGVRGVGYDHIGVSGSSQATDKPGTAGQSAASTGVLGYSGAGALPTTPSKTGVYGYAAQDADSRGVWGRSAAGRGVYGQSTSGQGVRGYSATGVAGYFGTSDPAKGTGLRVLGRARFDHCVGVVTIANGSATSVAISPGIDLTSTSAVVATLMNDAGGSTAVKRVEIDPTADTFFVQLTAANASGGPVKVAWHVFG